MKALLLCAFLVVLCSSKIIVTKELINELKKTATWEVTEYAENIFKGVDDDDSVNGSPESFVINNLRQIQNDVQANNLDCGVPIQNMGEKCLGSTFAFAVAGMVSSRCCAKKGVPTVLSPMEIISCDSGDYGCAGGWPAYALKYVEKNGLVPDDCYPYNGQNEGCPTVCKNGKPFKDAHMCNITNIVTLKSADDVKAALKNGPIVISFDAYTDLYTYKSGIYCHTAGAFKRVMSGLVVDYAEGDKPYIRIQMPFGKTFGEEGFIRMCTSCCGLFNKYEKGNVACDIKS
jgi:hypothetical protein